jgi:nucleoside-diphosphate-sugar epimerase
MRVLVTGASGFVGRALLRRLRSDGIEVVAIGRSAGPGIDVAADVTRIIDWQSLATGCSAVVHLAALAHRFPPNEPSEADYRACNSAPLAALAASVRSQGVRVVLVSSIGAVCESSIGLVNDLTTPQPTGRYGRSKLEGERLLREGLAGARSDWVILRPPLVYGTGHRGNMALIERLIRARVPIPRGIDGVTRSYIHVDNLVDAIVVACSSPSASRGTYVVSDGEAVTFREMVTAIAQTIGVYTLMVPTPRPLFRTIQSAAGMLERAGVAGAARARQLASRMLEPLAIDDSGFRCATGWRPLLDWRSAVAKSFRAHSARRNQ